MERNKTVVERDHVHVVAAQCAASAIPVPGAEPPAFLGLPNWTVEDTAEYLRCAPQTIRKALSQQGSYHGIKPRRFGRRWYFAAADVRSMLEVA